MQVVNFFGAPGSGKSTGAAVVFGRLKHHGKHAEMSREVIKDMIYEKIPDAGKNQLDLLSQQYKQLRVLQNYGVEVAVVDSPILAQLIYGREETKVFKEVLRQRHNEFTNINVYVSRVKPYFAGGRFQTEDEAAEIAHQVYKLVPEWDYEIKGSWDDYVGLADRIATERL